MVIIDRRPGRYERSVCFTYSGSQDAGTIAVVGQFNDWDLTRHRMRRLGKGVWQAVVYLAPGRYEYAYLIDESLRIADPGAQAFADAPGGGKNAVVHVS